MAPAVSRDRRGSSAVLWVVGAAFALYCLFLVRLHLWTQQTDGGSNRVGGGVLVEREHDARVQAEMTARALERVAREQRAVADRASYLRPGAKERAAAARAPTATAAAKQATTAPVKIDTPLTKKPAVTTVQPTPRPTERKVAVQAASLTQATPLMQAAPLAQAAPLTQAVTLTQAVPLTQAATLEARRAPLDAPEHEAEAPKVQAAQQLDTQAPNEAEPSAATTDDRMDVAVVAPIPQTTAPPTTEPHVPFRERHQVVAGYDKLLVFLESYMSPPGESLFLFFVCSDRQFRPDDWSPECTVAKQHVYSVFAKSPSRNRLVTVLAGSERYWKFQNDFYNDPDLRVKGVPCLMKWEGSKGRTSGMMVHETLQYDVFLRYLFMNDDQPDPYLTPEAMDGKQIVTVNGYEAYQDMMGKIKHEKFPVKTFMIMVSGRFKANNRPWCPYCRYSELPVEYAFYAFAPPNSRLVRVEVTNSYNEWKHPNKFNRDPELDMHVVPAFYKLQITPPSNGVAATSGDTQSVGSIVYERHKIRLDLLESLRNAFSQ